MVAKGKIKVQRGCVIDDSSDDINTALPNKAAGSNWWFVDWAVLSSLIWFASLPGTRFYIFLDNGKYSGFKLLERHQIAKVAKVISTLKVLHKLCLKLVLINSQKKIFKSHRCEVKKCIYSSTLKKLACMCRQTVSSGHQCATIEPETNYKHTLKV